MEQKFISLNTIKRITTKNNLEVRTHSQIKEDL